MAISEGLRREIDQSIAMGYSSKLSDQIGLDPRGWEDPIARNDEVYPQIVDSITRLINPLLRMSPLARKHLTNGVTDPRDTDFLFQSDPGRILTSNGKKPAMDLSWAAAPYALSRPKTIEPSSDYRVFIAKIPLAQWQPFDPERQYSDQELNEIIVSEIGLYPWHLYDRAETYRGRVVAREDDIRRLIVRVKFQKVAEALSLWQAQQSKLKSQQMAAGSIARIIAEHERRGPERTQLLLGEHLEEATEVQANGHHPIKSLRDWFRESLHF